VRSLSDLWRDGNPDEKEFVRVFLLAYSRGADVSAKDWRKAERDWRKALRLQDAYGESDPELAAINYLLAIIFTDEAIGD